MENCVYPNFIRAAMKFFGLLPGQTLGAFAQELDGMSYDQRREIAEMLTAEGFKFHGPF